MIKINTVKEKTVASLDPPRNTPIHESSIIYKQMKIQRKDLT